MAAACLSCAARANFFNHAPGFSHILRSALRLAPERQIPRLAPVSFLQMARKNRSESASHAVGAGAREVILWVDTFNNYFHSGNSPGGI